MGDLETPEDDRVLPFQIEALQPRFDLAFGPAQGRLDIRGQKELDGLVQDYIREEAVYREGMAMGLDQNDTIIRRRTRQKTDFIVEDMSTPGDPETSGVVSVIWVYRSGLTGTS